MVFSIREMFQPKYHWVEIKYLGAIQSQLRQLFGQRGNAFSQYTKAFALAIATCQREFERLNRHYVLNTTIHWIYFIKSRMILWDKSWIKTSHYMHN